MVKPVQERSRCTRAGQVTADHDRFNDFSGGKFFHGQLVVRSVPGEPVVGWGPTVHIAGWHVWSFLYRPLG
ncbi:MAG: hypothetical protein CMJ81_09090 [Planctomycetaceae bacterium]|nr:hypothetical protein [Planctomycetaceae bacterium]MBP60668.1 hypothetical protein [Planctomycetaceae bacterium]